MKCVYLGCPPVNLIDQVNEQCRELRESSVGGLQHCHGVVLLQWRNCNLHVRQSHEWFTSRLIALLRSEMCCWRQLSMHTHAGEGGIWVLCAHMACLKQVL